MITTLSLVTISHSANFSQYYWLYSPSPYLPIPLMPSPLPTTSLISFSNSIFVLFCFLDSTDKWSCMVFIFLCLTCFTQRNTLLVFSLVTWCLCSLCLPRRTHPPAPSLPSRPNKSPPFLWSDFHDLVIVPSVLPSTLLRPPSSHRTHPVLFPHCTPWSQGAAVIGAFLNISGFE